MTSLLAVLLCILGTATLGSTQNNHFNFQSCPPSQVKRCNGFLSSSLGVPESTIFTNYLLNEALLDKFSDGQDLSDVLQVCNFISGFYQCFGSYTFDACLGPLGFINQGYSSVQAYINDGFLAQWKYICSIGISIFSDDKTLKCIRETWAENRATLQNSLLIPYINNITYDPTHACTYTKNLRNGWMNIFAAANCEDALGNPIGRFFGCSMAEAYTNSQFPHCSAKDSCIENGTPNNGRVNLYNFLNHYNQDKNVHTERFAPVV